MPEKKFKCSVDGRAFKTKAGLDQHARDAHSSPKTPARSGPKAGKGSGKRSMTGSAPVSIGASTRGQSMDSARLSGVDRLYSGDLTTATTARSKVYDQLITIASFPRLAKVAAAFQRVRFLKLIFRIEPQMSTATSGGYVAAFVPDPDDLVSDLNSVTAQRGSVTTKWWQSSAVRAAIPPRLLYTSIGKEEREYSPGRFVFWSDGAPTQVGNVTVFAEWAVELSGASLEEKLTTSAEYTAITDWYTQSGGQVKSFTNKGKDTGVAKLLSPVPTDGLYLKAQVPFVVTQMNGNSRQVHWVYVRSGTIVPCYAGKTDIAEDGFKIDDMVVLKKSAFTLDTLPAAGEVQGPSSSVLQTEMAASSATSGPLSPPSGEEARRLLLELLTSLTRCETSRRSSSDFEKISNVSLESLPEPKGQ